MRGIILAGGSGTRLRPLTLACSKQLLPVYDKPMIYYPLSTLREGGITEVCVITMPRDVPSFVAALAGIRDMDLTYRQQAEPRGIAEAFLIAADFIRDEPVALILGDNLLHGASELATAFKTFQKGALIFGYRVSNPSAYGVAGFDSSGRVVSLEEKPALPQSDYAVPGLYLYDGGVVEHARRLVPSARGELEITDLNRGYLERGQLELIKLAAGTAWLDCGTPDSLLDAANYVRTIQQRQGVKVGGLA